MRAEPQRVRAHGIEIAYETFGDRGAPPLVLIMGLGAQMVAWPQAFCEDLAGRGHFVVRFDNRDIGLSARLDRLPVPSTADLILRRPPPYTIADMAEDVVGLLDALDLDRVHLVAASMGGFVAQDVALAHPDRLQTLTLMMSSTGSRLVGQPKPRLLPGLLRRPRVSNADEAVETVLRMFRLLGSPGYPLDEEHLRRMALESWERGFYRPGYRRQLAAVARQADRTDELSALRLPTLVVHGLHDPLVNASGGLALARAISHATFLGFSGMGHDLPRALQPVLAEQIHALTRRSTTRRAA